MSATATDAHPPIPLSISTAEIHSPLHSAWSAAILANQLPPIRPFDGDTMESGETFTDWIEQLEMVASISNWDERTRLVNLTTHLRGQAYSFYKSCP